MKNMMIAVALTAALPAAAFAQASAAPAASGSMQGMDMSDMNMAGMNRQKMSCKDMQSMMAKDHSMHMSKADMKGMDMGRCAKGTNGPAKTQPGSTRQR